MTEAVAGQEEEVEVKTEADTGEQPRDEHGRFTKPDTEQQSDDPAAAIDELRKQIAAYELRAKEAEAQREEARRMFDIEQRARAEAERRAGQVQDSYRDSQRVVAEAKYDAIVNAIAAANSALSQQKSAYRAALESGEFDKAADLSAEIGTTAARISQLDAGKSEIETQHSARPQQQQRQQQPSEYEQREAFIRSLPPRSAAWVRNNEQRYWADPQFQNMVAGAHHMAVGRGLLPESDDYFRFIEEQTGLRAQERAAAEAVETRNAASAAVEQRQAPTSQASTTTARRSPMPAAPAAGTSASTVRSSNPREIALTQEEREFCKLNDISETNYAKQKRTLIEEGRLGVTAVH